jgi:glyoxylase-like metal-dependent hydrolase (beta-lactamase superfamily II)/8-oxo-dGTP pyrophosphatase MutT (NUDIX family)
MAGEDMAEPHASAGTAAARPAIRRSLAAAVLLVRYAPGLQVYWVERAASLAYLGGFHAFPGGRVSPEDSEVTVAGSDDPEEARRRAAAARELFEEIGVLIVRPAATSSSPGFPEGQRRLALRSDVLDGTLSFAAMLAGYGLEVDGDALAPAGRWISPPFTPRGFDTVFYLARFPGGEEPSVVPGELAGGEWVEPAEAMSRWRRGDVLLATPVKCGLTELAQAGKDLSQVARALASSPEAQGGDVERIEVVPGVVMAPLPSSTIPPATHTNCLMVGEKECLLVDPGTDDPQALDGLEKLLARLEGRRVVAIAVTHHHRDHTAGASEMRRRLGVPLLAHPLLAGSLGADRVLHDGEVLTLAAQGGDDWHVQALFMPGHTQDHVVFHEPDRGVVIAGDLVSGLSTVVIDPPDGDLAAYMRSVERVAALHARVLFPGHGPPTGGVRPRLLALLEHRRERERRVLDALSKGTGSIDSLLPLVYADVPESQWKWARRSLLAHLLALEARGAAKRDQKDESAAWSVG